MKVIKVRVLKTNTEVLKEVTEDEIITALKRCGVKHPCAGNCLFAAGGKYETKADHCARLLNTCVLKLIKSKNEVIENFRGHNSSLQRTIVKLTAAIEELNKERESLIAGQETLQRHIAEKNKEIERLKALEKTEGKQ